MEMTGEEAVKELQKRFPNSTAITSSTFILERSSDKVRKDCYIHYNFVSTTCCSQNESSFEKCFEKLDQENSLINTEMKRMSILLRQF